MRFASSYVSKRTNRNAGLSRFGSYTAMPLSGLRITWLTYW